MLAYRLIRETGGVFVCDFTPLGDNMVRINYVERAPDGSPIPGPGTLYFWQIEQRNVLVALIVGPKHVDLDEPIWAQSMLAEVHNRKPPLNYKRVIL